MNRKSMAKRSENMSVVGVLTYTHTHRRTDNPTDNIMTPAASVAGGGCRKNTENVEIETHQQNVRTPHTAAGVA